jgi:anthranilate phosphoribosyltransferase
MDIFISKIGKGQRGSKDLTWDEAREAAAAMIEGQATPFQIGAFLMAMRIKMEAVTELAAFAITTRKYVAPLSLPENLKVVDIPIYGEKHETFHVSIAAAIVAAAGESCMLMHGVENAAVKSDTGRVLVALGIPADQSAPEVTEQLTQLHFAYLDLAIYHPPLARLLGLRLELGVQGLFHPVARMLNPARAQSQVIGVSHPPYVEKIAEAVSMMNDQRLLILQGVEGYPELSISTPTTMRELRAGRISPVNMKPKDVGLNPGGFRDMSAPIATAVQSTVQQEAHLIRGILTNTIQGGQRDWTIFNAGMLLYAGGKVSSIGDGVTLAHQLIRSGAAASKLESLMQVSKSQSSTSFAEDEVHA